MRISDGSSDVCSSDLHYLDQPDFDWPTKWQDWFEARLAEGKAYLDQSRALPAKVGPSLDLARYAGRYRDPWYGDIVIASTAKGLTIDFTSTPLMTGRIGRAHAELQSLMRNSYAVFCLKKKNKKNK